MPRLENWVLIDGKLFGKVYGDYYYEDGTEIITSNVIRIDMEDRIAVTRTETFYLLGEHHSEL